MRAARALTLVVVVALAAPVAAQPAPDAAAPSVVERLEQAATAAADRDWARVVELVGGVPDDAAVADPDRAEAHRLLGLAAFYRAQYDLAERHFHAFLQLDLDAQLDIALHAPDVVQFFASVRAKHAAELRTLRPRPRRWVVLNLVPPAGQFQNRQARKGWILGGVGATLLVANVGSYVLLDRWCSDVDRTCESGDASRADTARTLKRVNAAAGVALIGLYVYGVVDGVRHYRRASATATITVAPVTFAGRGGGLAVGGTF